MVSPRENVEWNYVKGNILLCPWRLPFRLYPLSILSLSLSLSPILVRPTNRPKGYKRTDPCVSPLFPLIFSPSLSLFLSLAVSTIQFLPSRVSLSSFLLCTEREREPESWVQQGAPGEIPSHGYWFTMPRIIRHYLMWYMGSRGQRFSRLERRKREREIGLLKLFSLSVFAARASFA